MNGKKLGKKINRSKNSYFRKVIGSLKGDEFINEKIDFENLSKNRKKFLMIYVNH